MSSTISKDWMLTPCDEWPHARYSNGYGHRQVGNRSILTHREAWENAYGPIPAGMLVCHHCDNRPCRNVEHLFLGTYGDNNRDAAAKGRLAGRRNWNTGKTHCIRGHLLDEANTYTHTKADGGKHRNCRECRRVRRAAAKKAA